jgi:hypothetical protein
MGMQKNLAKRRPGISPQNLEYLTIPRDGYVLVVSADHGVAPTPEANAALKMPGGRLTGNPVAKAVEAALGKRFGDARWVTNIGETGLYLNLEAIESKKLDRAEVDRVAADAAMSVTHVFRVYTREQLLTGQFQNDSGARTYPAPPAMRGFRDCPGFPASGTDR